MNMPQKKNYRPSPEEQEELRRIAEFYDSLTEEEWVAHDEYAYELEGYTDLIVPKELMPSIRSLIDRAEHDRRAAGANDPFLTSVDRSMLQEGNFPPGWDSERVKRVMADMESEEADWTEEDEAELQARMKGKASVLVPDEIVPAIEALLAWHEAEKMSSN